MDINGLRLELKKNNIRETAALIKPAFCPEGALCLTKRDDGMWEVTLDERGEYLVKESFGSEHAACRRFLKLALTDPTYRKDFKPGDPTGDSERTRRLLREYGFDSNN